MPLDVRAYSTARTLTAFSRQIWLFFSGVRAFGCLARTRLKNSLFRGVAAKILQLTSWAHGLTGGTYGKRIQAA